MIDLQSLQCHFNWNLIDTNQTDDNYQSLLGSLQTDIAMNPDIEIQALLYICFLSNHLDHDTLRATTLIDQTLDKCTSYDSNYSHAIGYKIIALGIKIHLIAEKDDDIEISKLSAELDALNLLSDDAAKSVINGTRGYALCMMDRERYAEGLHYSKMAFRLDPNFFGWRLSVAIMLGRLRRIQEGQTYPTELEEEMIQTAMDLSDNNKPLPIVFMADLYFSKGREMKQRPADEEWLKEAKKLYLRAYEMAPDSTHVLKRCGKAFSIMGDVDLAKECLLKAIALDPNSSMSFHRLGQVYEHKTRELTKAKECYKRAVKSSMGRNLYAEMDLGRINKKIDRSYDVLEYYRRMKLSYENDDRAHKHIDEAIERQTEWEERANERRQSGPNSNRGRFRPTYGNVNNNRGLLPTPVVTNGYQPLGGIHRNASRFQPRDGIKNTKYQPRGEVVGNRYRPRETDVITNSCHLPGSDKIIGSLT